MHEFNNSGAKAIQARRVSLVYMYIKNLQSLQKLSNDCSILSVCSAWTSIVADVCLYLFYSAAEHLQSIKSREESGAEEEDIEEQETVMEEQEAAMEDKMVDQVAEEGQQETEIKAEIELYPAVDAESWLYGEAADQESDIDSASSK